jgi:hypothetical protein
MSDRDDNEEIGNGINDINTTEVCTITAENICIPYRRERCFDNRLQIFKITHSHIMGWSQALTYLFTNQT